MENDGQNVITDGQRNKMKWHTALLQNIYWYRNGMLGLFEVDCLHRSLRAVPTHAGDLLLMLVGGYGVVAGPIEMDA